MTIDQMRHCLEMAEELEKEWQPTLADEAHWEVHYVKEDIESIVRRLRSALVVRESDKLHALRLAESHLSGPPSPRPSPPGEGE